MYPQYTYYYPTYLQAKVRGSVSPHVVDPTAVRHVLLDIVRYFKESVDPVVSKFVACVLSGGHFKSFFLYQI